MKKKLFCWVLGLCLTSVHVYGQRDSIVSYLDRKFELTTELSEAKYIESRVDLDTVWKKSIFTRDGKILSIAYVKDRYSNEFIGKKVEFHRNGELRRKGFYNASHKLHGKIASWFDNGNKDHTGSYVNGVKNGLWKYYHYNGSLAGKYYFTKGKLTKHFLFDEDGNEITSKEYTTFENPIFKKGYHQFNKEIDGIIGRLSYHINTTIHVSFTIGIEGEIRDVWVVNNVPERLKRQIEKYFIAIKGWQSAIDMNRKVPSLYSIALIFRKNNE